MKGAVKTRRPAIRERHGSRVANRLADRQKAHEEFPVTADGSEYTKVKPKSKQPGSLNPRKH